MKNRISIIGLDIGYGWTKAVGNTGNTISFASVMGPAVQISYRSDLARDKGNHHTYRVDDADWFVGEVPCRRTGDA